jgi:hypothetical protein
MYLRLAHEPSRVVGRAADRAVLPEDRPAAARVVLEEEDV